MRPSLYLTFNRDAADALAGAMARMRHERRKGEQPSAHWKRMLEEIRAQNNPWEKVWHVELSTDRFSDLHYALREYGALRNASTNGLWARAAARGIDRALADPVTLIGGLPKPKIRLPDFPV